MNAKTLLTGDAKAIVETLKNIKGQNVSITWKRAMKTRAGVQVVCEKETEAHIRAGIDYSKMAKVQEGIEEGTRGEVQSLPWGNWSEFPFIITHTPKGKTETQEYVRLYPASFDNLRPHVTYFLNGKECLKADVEPYCLASEFQKDKESPDCFTIKARDLVSIG